MKKITIDKGEMNKRILESPFCLNFYNSIEGFKDRISDDPVFDFSGLNDHEKLYIFILSYSKRDYVVFKRQVMKYFSWTSYKIRKLIKEINSEDSYFDIDVVPTFSEDTGLLSGKGYMVNY